MTTTLILQYPTPNHLTARVFRQQRDKDGKWVNVGSVTAGSESQITVHTIYGQQRLIIEERAANYPSEGDHPATDERDEHDEWMRANGAR